MPSIGPDNVLPQIRYEHYSTEEVYVSAVADAMRPRYKAIIEGFAGVVGRKNHC